jgi:hypothetical protein
VAKKASRRLVIDASVARSATLSDNPTSTACREFLQAILEVRHRIVLSAEIYHSGNVTPSKLKPLQAFGVRGSSPIGWSQ